MMTARSPMPYILEPRLPCALHDFPPEVLGLIFSFCQDPDLISTKSMYYLEHISAICQSWRTLAMSMSELWSSFAVEITRSSCSPPASVIGQWIHRSGAHPLSINLIFEDKKDCTIKKVSPPESIYPVLLAAVSRWKRVIFTFNNIKPIPRDYTPEAAFPILPVSLAPILDEVEITGLYGYCFDLKWIAEISALVAAAPLLRKFARRGRALEWGAPGLTLPWAQLTHLHLEQYIACECAFTILEESPRLLECSLRIHGLMTAHEREIISRVQALKISSKDELISVFRSLTTPDLQSLEIGFESFNALWETDVFTAFLSRSQCDIRSFTIWNPVYTRGKMLDCFGALPPSVRELKVLIDTAISPYDVWELAEVSDRVLKALTYDPASSTGPICPNLDSMVLEWCVRADDGRLSDMVASRRRAAVMGQSCLVAELVHFDVLFHSPYYPRDTARLQEMMEEGLRGRVRAISPGIERKIPPPPKLVPA